MKLLSLFSPLLFLMTLLPSAAGQSSANPFDNISDTTQVAYDDQDQSYRLTTITANQPTQASTKVTGDFILTAFVAHDRNAHRSAEVGLQVVEGAKRHTLSINLRGEAQVRSGSAKEASPVAKGPKFGYSVLRIEREGTEVHCLAAATGEPLQRIAHLGVAGNTLDIGAFLQAQDSSVASVWNVRIEIPVPDDYNASESGHLPSRLEILDVFTGKRKIIHTSDGRFEAPNWMPDSTRLLFNESGSLYTINIDGTDKTKLNTGFADRNNNDHGISFDGTKLAISHHRDDLPGGGSTVYVMDLAGGEPKLVTERTPSYWHGWAPNNEEVVYVARREQDHYDIYKKNINGGEELRLSDYEGSHADGPEYTPDGEYIYYNAAPTGTMQIWRMLYDGWNKEQITFDEYNDWFPHISPDGKWIAFLSFPTEINPTSHPAYKRVMLRLMPVSGGAPRVIAYLFGGQGTINVPSWSPDSKSIAFVSYSK